MGQETPGARKEVVQKLSLSADIEHRFRLLFKEKFYKTLAATSIAFGQAKAGWMATGKVYLTGSTNYALRVDPEMLPVQLFDAEGNLTDIQRPDTDLLLDLGVEHADELAHILRENLLLALPPGSEVQIIVKTHLYMPRLDIVINGNRMGEVLFLKDCAAREAQFRFRLGEHDLITENNLSTHLAAQTVKQEACAAELSVANDNVVVTNLWGLEFINPTIREDNPDTLFARDKILTLIQTAASEDELVMLDCMNNYIRVHFYRSLAKIAEIGQFFGSYPFVRSDVFHRLIGRARQLGGEKFDELVFQGKLIPEERHYRQKIARYIVRALLADPMKALPELLNYPFFEPFTNEALIGNQRPALMMEYAWDKNLTGNLGNHPGYLGKEDVRQSLELAAAIITKVKPQSFKEILAILVATCGAYERAEIEAAVESIAWPTQTEYMNLDERWGPRISSRFQPGLNPEEIDIVKDLAFALVQRIHPIHLRNTPNDFYVEGIPVGNITVKLLDNVEGGYIYGENPSSYTYPKGAEVTITDRQLLFQMLSEHSCVAIRIAEIAKRVIDDFRTPH
ncbi:MAG: hypothetical protein ABIE03_03455 [Patescibacteria group bacterium]|nr:hypothetical protein [Patescibacteria group bacterium]